jgi:hypothetical protein
LRVSPVGVKRKKVGTIVAALNDCSTCRGVEGGEIVGDEADKTFALAVGWQGPVSGGPGEKRSRMVGERDGKIKTLGRKLRCTR